MSRLRPLLGSLVAAAVCAILQGATVVKIYPDAGWLQATAILQLLTLPVAAVAGLLLGVAAPAAAVRARGVQAGLLAGLGIYLAPAIAVPFSAGDGVLMGWLAMGLWFVGCMVWQRMATAPEEAAAEDTEAAEPTAGAGTPRGAGHLLWILGGAALLFGAAGVVLPGPPPAIGLVPPSDDPSQPPAPAAQPNLVLIVLDTLRADRLGCYGYGRETTPFLDGLAANGLRYEDALAPGCHTPPSHASLFTGLPPSGHGIMGTTVPLPNRTTTLAGELRDAGYSTLGVVANLVLSRRRGWSQGFHLYDDSLMCHRGLGAASVGVTKRSAVGELLGRTPVGRHTPAKILNHFFLPRQEAVKAGEINSLALEHLDENRATGRPFFLFLNYMDVHSPYQAPGEDFDRFLEHDPGVFRERLGGLEFHHRLGELTAAYREGDASRVEELAALSDRYDGELHYLDSQLRGIVERVEALSQDRGFLLVVTSDHGELFGEHQDVGHGSSLFQEAVHVPLIVYGSGVPAGVVAEPVSLLDVPGTLLAAAGLPEPLGEGGVLPGLPEDLLPTKDEHAVASAGTRLPLSELGYHATRTLFPELEQVAVYRGPYKALYAVAAEGLRHQQTFDLADDPGEQQPRSEPLDDGDTSLQLWRESWWRRYLAGRENSSTDLGEAPDSDLAGIGYAGAGEAEAEDRDEGDDARPNR